MFSISQSFILEAMSTQEVHELRIVKPRKRSPGEQSGRVCVVHFAHSKDRLMRPLSQKAFETIQKAKKVRCSASNPMHRFETVCQNIPISYDSNRQGMHLFCYKKFTLTARVVAANVVPKVVGPSPKKTRSKTGSSSATSASASSILFPKKKCLFCGKGDTTQRGKHLRFTKCETKQAADTILLAARLKQDSHLLGKIVGIDIVAREARFHEKCRRKYIEHLPAASDKDKAVGSNRAAYDAAFKHVSDYITESVLEGGSVVTMLRVHEHYQTYMAEHAPALYNPNHQLHKLKERIVSHFGDRVQFWQINNRSGNLLYSSDLPTGAAVEVAFESAMSESKLLEDAAMILRRHILYAYRTAPAMPWPPTAAFLNSSTISPPDTLLSFVTRVITGTASSTPPSERAARSASSLAEDVCGCHRWTLAYAETFAAQHGITPLYRKCANNNDDQPIWSLLVLLILSRPGKCNGTSV